MREETSEKAEVSNQNGRGEAARQGSSSIKDLMEGGHKEGAG